MAIHCPYCKHGMSAKDAKPGRYKPKCSKCGQRFVLTIFPDAGRAPLAEPMAGDSPSASSSPAQEAGSTQASVEPPQSISADATIAHERTVLAASEATLPVSTTAATVSGVSASAADPAADTMPVARPAPIARQGTLQGSIDATQVAPSDSRTRIANDATIAAKPGGTVPTSSTSQSAPVRPGAHPDRIGGYKIVKELGRGAMGAVYLARQLSLDRDVALKTIQAQWAQNPTFVARFTREAYAAAQLTHHNVVQIYDLGVDGSSNYFSMEFVRGESLDELIKRSGPLPPDLAIGYILQAARGLRFAHQHGMVHRDIKPANMMLNDQGIVKIADLGLVKVFSAESLDEPSPEVARGSQLSSVRADVTTLNVAMGTPAYMAPEQADNAAGVDHRADIYSLGCSLYVMLTGKPPFEGASALDVITKHRTAAVVRPDLIVKNIPQELGEITLKMVAKRPEERYQTLDDVIKDLERFVSGGKDEKVAPTEEQAKQIRLAAEQFNSNSLGKIRGLVSGGFVATMLLLGLVSCLVSLSLAFSCMVLLGSAIAAYFVTSGIRERSPLFDRARAVAGSLRWTDWLQFAAGGLVILLALLLLGGLMLAVIAAVIGAGLGIAYWAFIDRRLAEQRRSPVETIESLLRGLRQKGLDESQIQLFVATESGRDWEELFEVLFGFDAKLKMREPLAQSASGATLRRFRSWRDPLVRYLEARIKSNREMRDRQILQTVEEKNLTAQGIDPAHARQQASLIANALVEAAATGRVEDARPKAMYMDPAIIAAEKRERIKRMLADARASGKSREPSRAAALLTAPFRFALSGRVRFLLGCLLIAGCALWARQNQMISTDDLRSAASSVSENLQASDLKGLTNAVKLQKGEPLNIPLIGKYFDSWYPGIAGVMLLVLGMFRGWKMSLFALPAAAAIVIGPSYGPPVLMLVVGLLVSLVGLIFGRSAE